MNQASLSSVALTTIENYRDAATVATRACQLGSQRLIKAFNKGIDDQVYSRTGEVAPNLTDALSSARDRMTRIVIEGIDQVASRAEKAMDLGYGGAAKQVSRAAEFVAAIDNPTLANGLQAVARFSLPTAKVALVVSSKVAEGAKAVSGAVSGKGFKSAGDAGIGKTVRRAKRQATAVSRQAAKTVRAKRKLA